MKLKLVIITLSIALMAGGTAACSFGGEPTPEPVPVNTVQQPNVVSAEAFVVPVQKADLSFEVNGRVVNLDVEEGDQVAAGQLLAELDNETQRARVTEAEAGLTKAKAGVVQAEANLTQAEAQLANTKAGATPEEIVQAEANLAKAEAALAELLAGPTPEDIAQAEAKIETARASLAQVLAGSRDEDIQAAASRLLKAESEVRLKQADYDANVFGDPDRAEPFGVALQQATLEFEQAQAEYDKLVNGATDEEVAISRAQLYEAQTALDKVLAGATAEQIAQAQAEVARAEGSLAQLIAGATTEEIAIDEAGVTAAEAAVQTAATDIQTAEAGITSAQADLAKTQLTAPFKGVVGSLNIEPGEIVQAGATIISVGDVSKWQIETDDLTEIDVVNVSEGARVMISVDALPDDELEGEVVRITPRSETKAGDVTYTVLIDITQGDTSKLRWGMTTFVDIEIGPEL